VTRAGLETNVDIGIRYIASWLSGIGAAAISDLMEDAATAEISRAQVWQWIRHRVQLADDETLVTDALVRQLADRTVQDMSAEGRDTSQPARAREIFELVALAEDFPPFLTLPAYDLID
jgi:malate synthase